MSQVKINFLGKFPENYSPYGELTEIDDYEVENLQRLGVDEIWYWYATAPYEGSG